MNTAIDLHISQTWVVNTTANKEITMISKMNTMITLSQSSRRRRSRVASPRRKSAGWWPTSTREVIRLRWNVPSAPKRRRKGTILSDYPASTPTTQIASYLGLRWNQFAPHASTTWSKNDQYIDKCNNNASDKEMVLQDWSGQGQLHFLQIYFQKLRTHPLRRWKVLCYHWYSKSISPGAPPCHHEGALR